MRNIEEILGVVLLVLFCYIISSWETKRTGTLVTPFSMMIWPYAIVVILVNTVGVHFGFFSVNFKSIAFIMGCALFFMAGGTVVKLIFPDSGCGLNEREKTNSVIDQLFTFYRPLFVTIAIISICVGFLNLIQSVQTAGGWIGIASAEFEEAYGKGLFAHIMTMNRAAFLFLFADYMRKKRTLILVLLALIFITVLVLQIKNHIITILIGGLFFAYQFKLIKFNFRKILIYGAIIYFLFNVSYGIGFSKIGLSNAYSSKVQLYLLSHFFTYLFGGPIGFSEALQNPVYPLYTFNEVFAVIVNIYKALTGDKTVVDVIISNWLPVSTIYKYFHSSNVFTMFGMLYMYIGPYWTYLYLFFLGAGSYWIRSQAMRTQAAIGWKLVYAFLLSYLTLSFFGLYFNTLLVYEAAFFMLLLPAVYRGYRFLTARRV